MSQDIALVTDGNEFIRDEAKELAISAGYVPKLIFQVKRTGLGRMGISEGKAIELKAELAAQNIGKVLINGMLNAGQMFNLTSFLETEAIDRQKLILEIFAKRAITPEAKLQVRLAELKYQLPRVKENVRLSKKGEQPAGMFGSGRYDIDKYVMSIKEQINSLNKKIKAVSDRRSFQMKERLKVKGFVISLAGYTGSGKTTIFNRLTAETKPVTGRPFTTLSPTIRRLPGKEDIFISDTVGFIEGIPHYLVEAFKSTLAEITYADLVLLVTDVSVDQREFIRRYNASMKTFTEIGVSMDKVLVVENKYDISNPSLSEERMIRDGMARVKISAKTGYNMNVLMNMLEGFAHNR
ncbi:MAG: GTPase HflX [Nitrososphaerota archaeon]|nr:GTPase HflX [Nitrososphaerota archaeon]MDG7048567.1 GTPase HflX [Nitrososphaerota archaeon]MDG7051097.1 GTPase HflX [Nitrososphaerota archaeon]